MEEVTKAIRGILGIIFIGIGMFIVEQIFLNEGIEQLMYIEGISILDILKTIFHI